MLTLRNRMKAKAARSRGDEAPQTIRLSRRQWRKSAQTRLEQLGLTYEELAVQAANRNFTSTEARKLWYVIGGTL